MRVLEPTAWNLELAAECLRSGELVGMPTETVYGLAGAALNPQALTRIFSAKDRPTFDPLILHVRCDRKNDRLEELAEQGLVDLSRMDAPAREMANRLMAAFWPGPLTLVLPKTSAVPDLATSGLTTVALRMPAHPVALEMLRVFGAPLAAPSANRFGRISPTRAEHVVEELKGRVALVVDGGPCRIGVESTVVAIDSGGALTLLRPGGASVESLEKKSGATLKSAPQGFSSLTSAQVAPGMLASHYAPAKPLRILPGPALSLAGSDWAAMAPTDPAVTKLGLLVFQGTGEAEAAHLTKLSGLPVEARSLSVSGKIEEAAHELFSGLRALDGSEAQLLYSEPCPETRGLGHAIADRLKRASTRATERSGS